MGAAQAVSPAWAGGVGDFLSPAFGTSCANNHAGALPEGATTHGTGTANGNLAGLPIRSPLNQCGDAPANRGRHPPASHGSQKRSSKVYGT
ncbi:chaplin family protein [Streptomyces phaeoluteigriseus]|uniref:chaplin family protein n=1 Tax=Streptomyces phaeoluteigriseus TaxID=114686 RepID=UPI003673DAE6